jgi:SAM-dependent methyltransferase
MYTRRQKIDFLSAAIDLDGAGLEIGPHTSPMFRRSQGVNVRYLETRSAEELRALVRQNGGDPSVVEEIDYILERGKTLLQHSDGTQFDWVTSSHVIEHIPDFLGHMAEVAEVLKPGGTYALIVPDRNYCFDCLKAPTLLGHVIEAHLTAHRPGAVAYMINEWRYGARPEGVRVGGWTKEQAGKPLVRKMADWQKHVRRVVRTGGEEVDRWFGHQWFFDPPGFAEILCDLIELEMFGFDLETIEPTYNMDFMVVLRKSENPDLDRARSVLADLRGRYEAPEYDRVIQDA